MSPARLELARVPSRRVITGACKTRGGNANQHCKGYLKDIKQSSTQLHRRDAVFPKVVFRAMLQKSDAPMFVGDSSALAHRNSRKLAAGTSAEHGEIAWRANRQ
jgi:hypothetical protein